MAIRCPFCGREFDVTLFEFEREIICECGKKIGLNHIKLLDNLEEELSQYEREIEEEKLLKIKIESERIASLILNFDYPKIDIEIERTKFKELIKELFPQKVYLYELIFEPRFNRLWEQFRANPEA